MAFRAARFSEEKQLATLWITANRSGLASSLKNPQVAHHRLDLWQTQCAKRRHPRRWDSRLQDAQSLLVGQPLNFLACGDVRSTLAALPVQAVAGGTNGFERFPAVFRVRTFILIFSGGSIGLLRSRLHYQCGSRKK